MDAPLYVDPMVLSMASIAISLVALVVMLVVNLRQRKLLKRYKLLLSGTTGHDLEQHLMQQATAIEFLQQGVGDLVSRFDVAATAARLHVQRTAIIRFNAFPDTGSDLSFAIALLNADNNGLVLSSLYGRNESRVYAKPIQDGKSTYQLTDEEKEALAKAMGSSAK